MASLQMPITIDFCLCTSPWVIQGSKNAQNVSLSADMEQGFQLEEGKQYYP